MPTSYKYTKRSGRKSTIKPARRAPAKRKPSARTAAPRRTMAVAKKSRSSGGGWASTLNKFAGAAAKTALNHATRAITGLGDYHVNENALVNPAPGPIINNNTHGGVVIRHREYLGDVNSSVSANAFKLTSYPLQPASPQTFPWLSQVAANFQEYSFEGLIFEFVSMSADALNSTNTALGQVIMATNYNAGALPYASKQEMENSEFAISTKPSKSQVHLIECEPRRTAISTMLYIRQGAVPAGQDVRLYDWGNFQLATNGFQATNVNAGELWVSYQVALNKPILAELLGDSISLSHIYNPSAVISISFPFGASNTQQVIPRNDLGLQVFGNSLQWTTPNVPTHYKLSIRWIGDNNISIAYPNFTPGPNITLVPYFAGLSNAATFTAPTITVPSVGFSSTQMFFSLSMLVVPNSTNASSIAVGSGGSYPAPYAGTGPYQGFTQWDIQLEEITVPPYI